MGVTIDDKAIQGLLDRLRGGLKSRAAWMAVDSGRELVALLRKNIEESKDADGRPYQLVKHVTEILPIKYGFPNQDTRIRKSVTSNPRAFNVTGRTRNSLTTKRLTENEVVVEFDDSRTSLVINANARPTKKPKRDPFGVTMNNPSSREMDVVEKVIEKELGKLLDGL